MSAVAERVPAAALGSVAQGRRRRLRRRRVATTSLALLTFVLFVVSLMVGHTSYGPGEVVRVIMGETVPGASFTVGELRLPRAVLAVLVGGCFGMAGISFQTMLRNPLAAPDIIGISSGASAAAVYAIVDSPRVRDTIDAIARELDAGGPLLHRYPPGEYGLPGGEGAFVPCAFWLVQALATTGRVAEAERRLDALLGLASPLGLYAEEIDPSSGRHLGNYPQALSHAALVQALLALPRGDA